MDGRSATAKGVAVNGFGSLQKLASVIGKQTRGENGWGKRLGEGKAAGDGRRRKRGSRARVSAFQSFSK
ncbi:hypothetical protein RHMOL_Rhmol10G0143000 [Rhododendron molle]|uniref:Uncharacterized protein n=1 Tax=Rhododendron molle TaxID=49168 RepID=A0ACC0M3A7_RHOML|nr:hypothetical protein RHMOL_Rhmol10G0143000 [Rhododendron molle]